LIILHLKKDERLETKGKYNCNFYEFVDNIEEFKNKKFIKNMLIYYENVKNKNKTKNEMIVLKEVYNICITSINIFRPLIASWIFSLYKPTKVLDFCMGWGGRFIGASLIPCIKSYIGIEINRVGLETPYKKMSEFIFEEGSEIIPTFIFEDALNVDYSVLDYDMVLTSPPYYEIEKYPNNHKYLSKNDMDNNFYKPLIEKTYRGLREGGIYAINVNEEIYKRCCVPVLGECITKHILKKSKRHNEYTEFIYVWGASPLPPP
jgi:tRNA1(Val) A37 N6-methylase TrmN6